MFNGDAKKEEIQIDHCKIVEPSNQVYSGNSYVWITLENRRHARARWVAFGKLFYKVMKSTFVFEGKFTIIVLSQQCN